MTILGLDDPDAPLPVVDGVQLLHDVSHVGSFLGRLSFHELQRLRAIVRRVHMRNYRAEFCTDRECDRMIEAMGPRVAEIMVKRAVEARR